MNSSLKTRAQGKPGNSGPAACAFFCPGPLLGNFTKKISLAQQHKTLCSTRPNTAQWRRGFRRPISSEPAPSHRPWTLPAGATLPTTTSPYHDHFRRPRKIGTFYFAQNRNFLLCLDSQKRVRVTYTQKNRRKDALLSAHIWACVVIECAP